MCCALSGWNIILNCRLSSFSHIRAHKPFSLHPNSISISYAFPNYISHTIGPYPIFPLILPLSCHLGLCLHNFNQPTKPFSLSLNCWVYISISIHDHKYDTNNCNPSPSLQNIAPFFILLHPILANDMSMQIPPE